MVASMMCNSGKATSHPSHRGGEVVKSGDDFMLLRGLDRLRGTVTVRM